MRLTVVVLASVSVGACASASPEIPVAASPEGVAALAGEWVGSYDFPERGRAGSILFRLESTEVTAHGDVLMLLDDPNARYTAWGGADPWARAPGPTTVFLDISFVRSDDGVVTGALDPYEDPVCSCTLTTRFEGRIEGDRIRGTFTAFARGGEDLRGEWEIERMPR